jgi:hypothetical protein
MELQAPASLCGVHIRWHRARRALWRQGHRSGDHVSTLLPQIMCCQSDGVTGTILSPSLGAAFVPLQPEARRSELQGELCLVPRAVEIPTACACVYEANVQGTVSWGRPAGCCSRENTALRSNTTPQGCFDTWPTMPQQPQQANDGWKLCMR